MSFSNVIFAGKKKKPKKVCMWGGELNYLYQCFFVVFFFFFFTYKKKIIFIIFRSIHVFLGKRNSYLKFIQMFILSSESLYISFKKKIRENYIIYVYLQ